MVGKIFLDTHQKPILQKLNIKADLKKLENSKKLPMSPPPGMKKLDTGQSDILVLADVPPPQEWKSWMQVKVTFWFWLMYPPQKLKLD